MTPLEQLKSLKEERDRYESYDVLFTVCTILGLIVMVTPWFFGVFPWSTWLIGVMLFTPNWVVMLRKSGYNSQINKILQQEAEAALKEKYGREETS